MSHKDKDSPRDARLFMVESLITEVEYPKKKASNSPQTELRYLDDMTEVARREASKPGYPIRSIGFFRTP